LPDLETKEDVHTIAVKFMTLACPPAAPLFDEMFPENLKAYAWSSFLHLRLLNNELLIETRDCRVITPEDVSRERDVINDGDSTGETRGKSGGTLLERYTLFLSTLRFIV